MRCEISSTYGGSRGRGFCSAVAITVVVFGPRCIWGSVAQWDSTTSSVRSELIDVFEIPVAVCAPGHGARTSGLKKAHALAPVSYHGATMHGHPGGGI